MSWQKSHFNLYPRKQGIVYTEFESVKNTLTLYQKGAKLIGEEIVYLNVPRRYFKIKVRDIRAAYMLMEEQIGEIWNQGKAGAWTT